MAAAVAVMFWSVAVMYFVLGVLHLLQARQDKGRSYLMWLVLGAAWIAGAVAWYYIGWFFPR
jgi:hypothetical protein